MVKRQDNIGYMIRHLITVNLPDPLPQAERGNSKNTLYFSGDGTATQINYLDYTPVTSGFVEVYVDDVLKTKDVHYTFDTTNLQVKWDLGFNPTDNKSNIKVIYQAIKRMIYDDHPFLSQSHWPRISVDLINQEYKTYAVGEYQNYTAGVGNLVTCKFNIIIRHRKNPNYYTFNDYKRKNIELINAMCEHLKDYMNTNRTPCPWEIWDWSYDGSTRRREEEMEGVLRKDNAITVRYFDKS